LLRSLASYLLLPSGFHASREQLVEPALHLLLEMLVDKFPFSSSTNSAQQDWVGWPVSNDGERQRRDKLKNGSIPTARRQPSFPGCLLRHCDRSQMILSSRRHVSEPERAKLAKQPVSRFLREHKGVAAGCAKQACNQVPAAPVRGAAGEAELQRLFEQLNSVSTLVRERTNLWETVGAGHLRSDIINMTQEARPQVVKLNRSQVAPKRVLKYTNCFVKEAMPLWMR
jgi:hypothetical protein